jgi:class 3 adenylate cyclase
LVLLVSTVFLAVIVKNSASRNEYERFEAQFSEHASKIFDSLVSNLEHGIGEVDNLAVSITSYTGSVNTPWPYALVPEFEIRAASTRKLANAALISLVPLVEEPQRQDWENFALQSSSAIEHPSIPAYDHPARALQESETSSMESVLQEFFNNYGSTTGTLVNFTDGIAETLYRTDGINKIVEDHQGPFYPIWQHSPSIYEGVNFNLISHKDFGTELQLMVDSQQAIIGQMVDISARDDPFNVLLDDQSEGVQSHGPVGTLYFPLFNKFDLESRDLVGLLIAIVRWTDYLQARNLPSKANGIVCVLANECDQEFTFHIVNSKVIYLGEGDLHDDAYDQLEESVDLSHVGEDAGTDGFTYSGVTVGKNYCEYSLYVYPTTQVEASYMTNKPLIYTVVVVVVFAVTSFIIAYYDALVEKKQRVLVTRAVRSHQIVSSLFPSNVRDRLFGDNSKNDSEAELTEAHPSASQPLHRPLVTEKLRLKNFLHAGEYNEEKSSKPIADLFAHCTVLFADIAGFTAWSSVREPAQVFTLLEHIYAAFDKIAVKRRVFKVETIGDSYVAVTGLPDPQPNHATIMVRFSRECLEKFKKVTTKLEVELGPETGELGMRYGIHSGPVTAGVLRGQKSRFQLFGDTVNTAARMESTGKSNKIQCSQSTGACLMDTGKGNWLTPREEAVTAKGKGVLKTYWVTPIHSSSSTGSRTSETHSESSQGVPLRMESFDLTIPRRHHLPDLSPHQQRLIGWTVELLAKLLREILAHRQSVQVATEVIADDEDETFYEKHDGRFPIDEYAECIKMPKFIAADLDNQVDPESLKLDAAVEEQLRDYVATIACTYRDNPFHNYEHASHVTMSVNKILKRVVQAEDCDRTRDTVDNIRSHLHNFTYGITSDPLTHFTCVFAAMIHDVDHPGVGNMQLVNEKDEMALAYDNKSVAEQNSIDVAWELLMDPAYEDLRHCIYSNEKEFQHFRNMLVNLVMATDIFDPNLMKMRNDRWAKAFDDSSTEDRSDHKATIVIENIIQASDVAHTMQHWHVYQKWNKRFFTEQYTAFKAGRMAKDPAEGWYKGELWFYDNYIIPLAKKLKECGVFGVASDEFLSYAMDNRSEWAAKGEDIVKELKEEVLRQESAPPPETEEESAEKDEKEMRAPLSKHESSTDMSFD